MQNLTVKELFSFIHFAAELTMQQLKADTTYGKLGVKVWIYRGEVASYKKKASEEGGKYI